MLSERYRELLTAFVDGELSARQKRQLQKLLRRSPEARTLLKQMQADSQELRALATPRLEQDLSDSVLTLIAQRQIQPPRPRVTLAAQPALAGSIWPHLAAAAAVLLAVGVASFLFFVFSFEPAKSSAPIARDQHKASPEGQEPKRPADASKELIEKNPAQASTSVKPDGKQNDSTAVAKVNPEPPKPVDEPYTAPSMELFELKKADVTLPVVVQLHDLDKDAKRQALVADLKKASSFRLEIPSSNGSKALERLQAAARVENIGMLIEHVSLDRFQKPVLKTNYVVFVEDITPAELTRWLQRVAVEDNKPDAKKQRNPQLKSLVLTQMTKQDHEQLSKLLGVDPATMKVKGPLGTDVNKPVADKTAEQVAASLAGQGGAPRPAVGSTIGKAAEQTALVVAYNPVRPNPNSPEIKRWLENRKPARPGTLQILLVLRTM